MIVMKRLSSLLLLALLFLSLATPVAALIEFQNEAEEKRFQALAEELRCLVCQNQSLADSDASLAGDLRLEVLEQMRSGKSDQEVIDFLVSRYGNFVRYRPPVEPSTWALWFGPFVVFLLGGFAVVRTIQRRAQLSDEDPDQV
ncbi:MAG: cytochrome c biogenesis protein [Lysobacteraceae bacterium]|nr:MAG: cytochrome c biogenesis protein [Xanthomonadaceae bacterium]